MDNSVYIALSRQTSLFRNMDMVANNIANANTTGFQSEHMMFADYLVDDGNHHKMAFTQDITSYRNLQDGALKTTGNPLDVAIVGNGYFMVETPQGQRYTRAGSFQLDANGVLINAEGYPVLDEGGQRIEFTQEDQDIVIGETGNISVNGEERGTLGVVEFENEQFMTQIGGQLFKTDQPALPPQNSRIVHGAIEGSNVSPVHELVNMIKVSRGVGNTAKFIEVMYDLQRKSSNVYAKENG